MKCCTQTFYMYYVGDSDNATSKGISTDIVCWYRFIPRSSSIKYINIQILSLKNATAEVYYEYYDSKFDYIGTVTTKNLEQFYYNLHYCLNYKYNPRKLEYRLVKQLFFKILLLFTIFVIDY